MIWDLAAGLALPVVFLLIAYFTGGWSKAGGWNGKHYRGREANWNRPRPHD